MILPKLNSLLEGYISFGLSFSVKVQAEKTDSGFPKTFQREYLFVFVEYLCNRRLKTRAKHFINSISILPELAKDFTLFTL